MIIEIPILIPVKGYSERCHKKNYALLPYTAKYIHAQAMTNSTTIITDSVELMDLAKSLGLNSHMEVRDPNQDELTSCWNFAQTNNIDLFFLCPVTQPFRSPNLMDQMRQLFQNQKRWDFITTVSAVQDRRIFFVRKVADEYRFKYISKNRKGSDCQTEYMIDGVLYLIRTSFLKGVINTIDANERFWKGEFTCIKNEAPFMDVDTKDDMVQFEFLKQYFKKSFAYPML